MKISRRAWLMFVLLGAFALRAYRLGVASLWYDETVSAFLAQLDPVSLTRHTAGDIHPPLYYYLLHFWGRLAGWSEFSLAFSSLFFGILLIALTYRGAREWLGAPVAMLAALLVAISPYNLWYSQEVRMYSLGAALGLASVYFFVRLLRQQATDKGRQIFFSRDFIAYAIVSALGLYTLYYFAFLLIFENLVALVRFARKSKSPITNYSLRLWISSQFAIFILYLPWAFIALRQAIDPPVPPWRSFTSLPQVVLESFSALAFGQSIDPAYASPLLLIIALLVGAVLWHDRRGWFWFGYTFVPLATIFLLSFWKPLYHVRYLFIYASGFYILLALALDRLRAFRRSSFILLAACIVLLSAFSIYNFWFDLQYADDDLRGAARYIAERYRPGDAILIDAGYTYTAFVYYFDQPIAWRGRLTDYTPRDSRDAIVLQTGSIGGAANLGWQNPESDFYPTTAEATRAALDKVLAAHPRVWLFRLYDTVVDPEGVIRDYLAQRGKIIDDQGFAGESFARAQGYLTSRTSLPALPANATRVQVSLGNRITLLGFDPGSLTIRAGDPIDVNVYWQTQEPTNIDQHLFVGLFSPEGMLVAPTNEIPLGNAWGTSRWTPGEILREPVRLMTPAYIPPGNYVLRVALFNPQTNEPLPAQPGAWAADFDQVRLTNVRIEK